MKFQCPECDFIMEHEGDTPPRCRRHSLHFRMYRDARDTQNLMELGYEMKPVELAECPSCKGSWGVPTGLAIDTMPPFNMMECKNCGHEWGVLEEELSGSGGSR